MFRANVYQFKDKFQKLILFEQIMPFSLTVCAQFARWLLFIDHLIGPQSVNDWFQLNFMLFFFPLNSNAEISSAGVHRVNRDIKQQSWNVNRATN